MVFQTKTYTWGAIQYPVAAETVGEVLEKIEARDGKITKESFLEESRPEGSVTHGLFEWDDQKAAERYRLVQAGKIIHNLEVHVTVEDRPEPIQTKAVVSVTPGRQEKAQYASIETAFSHTDTREVVLYNARRELECFRQKYAGLQELAGIFEEIDRLVKSMADAAAGSEAAGADMAGTEG